MKYKNLIKGAAVASLLALASQTVIAHSGATGVVKERMDGMGVMREAMKVLTPMMQGRTNYDATLVREHAEDISRHSGEALTKLFPEGSIMPPSEARPEIWQDWESFSELSEQLLVTAEGLAAASENGLVSTANSSSTTNMMGGGMSGSESGAMMGGMMAGGSSGGMMDFAKMPADRVFAMMGQVCSACHTRFRAEK